MTDAPLPNRPPDEAAGLVEAARAALTDRMVERLAATGESALALLGRVADERTGEALHVVLDRLTELHKLGALDTLFDLVLVLHAARSAATDGLVERVFAFIEQVISAPGGEAMGALAENARSALDEAAEEAARQRPRGGMLATLALLARPESQRSLAFLLSFADKLARRTAGP